MQLDKKTIMSIRVRKEKFKLCLFEDDRIPENPQRIIRQTKTKNNLAR